MTKPKKKKNTQREERENEKLVSREPMEHTRYYKLHVSAL